MVKVEVNTAFGNCPIREFEEALSLRGFSLEMVSERECVFPAVKYVEYRYKTDAPLNLVIEILNSLPITKNDYIVGCKRDCIKIISWD